MIYKLGKHVRWKIWSWSLWIIFVYPCWDQISYITNSHRLKVKGLFCFLICYKRLATLKQQQFLNFQNRINLLKYLRLSASNPADHQKKMFLKSWLIKNLKDDVLEILADQKPMSNKVINCFPNKSHCKKGSVNKKKLVNIDSQKCFFQ